MMVGLAAMVSRWRKGFLPLAIVGGYAASASWRAHWFAALHGPAPTRRAILAVIVVGGGLRLAVAPWSVRNQLAYNLASPSTFGRTMIARNGFVRSWVSCSWTRSAQN